MLPLKAVAPAKISDEVVEPGKMMIDCGGRDFPLFPRSDAGAKTH